MGGLRIRKNIRDLKPTEMDNLIRAFHHIMNVLPVTDNNSYWKLAGYHGVPAPFYCYHGVVLFPTWHRAYLLQLENALRSAPGCGNDVTMPYWDEIAAINQTEGLPKIFTTKEYRYSYGKGSIPNPLFSYKFGAGVDDRGDMEHGVNDPSRYSKHKGYSTVRYPYSGLVGLAEDRERTVKHNSDVDGKGDTHAVDAPNYTVFSNTTSADAYNETHKDSQAEPTAVSLEAPHNAIHMAVGGWEVPGRSEKEGTPNVYPDANGDMGENETAAFDPLFWFHHAWTDRTFWEWQMLHGATDRLEFVKGDPGTKNPVEGQPDLTVDSPLTPFKYGLGTRNERAMTTKDVVNIKTLGYDYAGLDRPRAALPPKDEGFKLSVMGINRAVIPGGFMVTLWSLDTNGQERLLHIELFLGRWKKEACDNCMNHLMANTFLQLPKMPTADDLSRAGGGSGGSGEGGIVLPTFYAKMHTRDAPGGKKLDIGVGISCLSRELRAFGDMAVRGFGL
ncbi:uncharacterized protein B0I36DRAFT_399102 [Microdochium trichocladiopsis]|uniref:tyrosinase n=1 Tax=Microdochium trichocladiopsis TaxID=1682393 RepID=A0A9P9BHZ3_9PEZI|nr:uncharacterized protein B0I36DRAFT_399102 [Microdochium trichocladiopsis]KAH7012547.1 hypothetical protein B0I36DRAFT_399102 [Microdochium trichocladiopsis]